MADEPNFTAKTQLDWIDALGILLTAGACATISEALVLNQFLVRALFIAVVFGVPWARRRWFGVPDRRAARAASVLGLLSTLLIVVGIILGGFDLWLVYLEATNPPPTAEERTVMTPPGERALQLAEFGAVAVSLLAAGGLLDSKLQRDADEATPPSP